MYLGSTTSSASWSWYPASISSLVSACALPPALVATSWFEDELGIIVSSSHKLADRSTFLIPDDLKETSWVMREEGSGTAEIFTKKLGRYASMLKVVTKTRCFFSMRI